MPKFDITLVNLTLDHKKWWTRDIRYGIKVDLTLWFEAAAGSSKTIKPEDIRCLWRTKAQRVDSTDLLIYFVAEKHKSIITKKLGPPPRHGTGGTWDHQSTVIKPQGMISEVYVGATADANRLHPHRALSVLAFHELMHNKLDAEANPVLPVTSASDGIHDKFSGAHRRVTKAAHLTYQDTPTGAELKFLGEHLDRPIKQYDGGMGFPKEKII